MKTLREYIKEAEEKKIAIGHFNVSTLEALHAIYNSAKKLSLPIIIGVSEGEEDFVGISEIFALVKTIRQRDNYPIFLNADHHKSFERVKKCIDIGFDAVIIDAVKLSFEDNIKLTKECVMYAKEVNAKTGRDILVEAEIGYIGEGSDIKETVPEGAGLLTKPEEAKKFVELTGVDLLAPSVGSIHGFVKSGMPSIHSELIKEIRKTAGVPLVLHGGSGLSDLDFNNAIDSGISIIHINSEIRLAWRDAIKKYLDENINDINPTKILKGAKETIEAVVEFRLKLFNRII